MNDYFNDHFQEFNSSLKKKETESEDLSPYFFPKGTISDDINGYLNFSEEKQEESQDLTRNHQSSKLNYKHKISQDYELTDITSQSKKRYIKDYAQSKQIDDQMHEVNYDSNSPTDYCFSTEKSNDNQSLLPMDLDYSTLWLLSKDESDFQNGNHTIFPDLMQNLEAQCNLVFQSTDKQTEYMNDSHSQVRTETQSEIQPSNPWLDNNFEEDLQNFETLLKASVEEECMEDDCEKPHKVKEIKYNKAVRDNFNKNYIAKLSAEFCKNYKAIKEDSRVKQLLKKEILNSFEQERLDEYITKILVGKSNKQYKIRSKKTIVTYLHEGVGGFDKKYVDITRKMFIIFLDGELFRDTIHTENLHLKDYFLHRHNINEIIQKFQLTKEKVNFAYLKDTSAN